MPNDDLETILDTCLRLSTATCGLPIDSPSGPRQIVIHRCRLDDKIDFVVGTSSNFEEPESCFHCGRGPTMLDAAKDWRERLVKHLKNEIVNHDRVREFLKTRELLG